MARDLCEYAKGCLDYKNAQAVVNHQREGDLEEATLQIDGVCMNSTRLYQTCYKEMRDLNLNKWVDKVAG